MKFIDLGNQVLVQRAEEGIRGISRELSRWRCHVSTAPFAGLPVAEIRTLHIVEWVRDMARKDCATVRGGKLSRGTIQRSLALVSAVFVEAITRGLVETNPCTGVRVKKPAHEASNKEKWTYFTLAEEEAIATCEGIPEADRLAILFALYTGVRQGEQFNLELVDLHVDGPNPRAVIRYGSKGLPPKSGKVRDVPLIPQAVEVSRRWLALLPTFATSNPDGLVFPTARGRRRQQGKPLGRSDVFARYLKVAGLEKHARWHDLRHGCASALIGGWWGRRWPLEMSTVEVWHYLSFVTGEGEEERFAGACVVRGADVVEAVKEAHRLGCSPGGQVLGVPIPDGHMPPERFRERLLSKADCDAAWGDCVRLGDVDDLTVPKEAVVDQAPPVRSGAPEDKR